MYSFKGWSYQIQLLDAYIASEAELIYSFPFKGVELLNFVSNKYYI